MSKNDTSKAKERFALLLALVLLSLALVGCASVPEDKASVETAVRAYIQAYQDQRWNDLLNLTHPKTIERQRDGYLAVLSEADVQALLGASSIDEARKQPPRDLVLKMLERGSNLAATKAMKEVQSEIKSVSVKPTAEGITADAFIVSTLRGKEFRGNTHFLLEKVNGNYVIVSMTKTRSAEP